MRFLISTLTLLLLLIVAYMSLAAMTVEPPSENPWSSQQFVLESMPGPRLIIDSGSNSTLSVNPHILERALDVPVLRLSDNAGVPLTHKLYRLLDSARPGDTILLPLEWGYFFYNHIPSDYYFYLLREYSHYYHALPWLKKMQALLTISPKRLLGMHLGMQPVDDPSKLSRLLRHLHFIHRGYMLPDNRNRRYQDAAAALGMSCSDYILGNLPGMYHSGLQGYQTSGFSDYFLDSLELMSDLVERGIQVIVLPPAVTGTDCYENVDQQQFAAMLDELGHVLEQHGVAYLGDWQASYYSEDSFYDTYYHVLPLTRDRYTQALVETLQGHMPLGSPDDLARSVAHLQTRIGQLFSSQETAFQTWDGQLTSMTTPEVEEYNPVLFGPGWHKSAQWAHWTGGNVSVLLFKPTAVSDLSLKMDGIYFSEEEDTEVFFAADPVGQYRLNRQRVPLTRQSIERFNGFVPLVLQHEKPQSPQNAGDGDDVRMLKYGLREMSFEELQR
jgi:hypothetical protein